MSNSNLYWCDHCATAKVDNKGNDTLIFYGCYTSQHYSKHNKTKKHLENIRRVEQGEIIMTCKKCNQRFSEEGYNNHEKRNKELWGFQKIGMLNHMTCNNFNEGKKRYGSMKEVRSSRESKPKAKRVKVGKISPVTGMIRKRNKSDGRAAVEVEQEPEPIVEPIVEHIKMSIDEEDILSIKCNDNELTEDEYRVIDQYGTKLYFEEYCDKCNLAINYDFSERLITQLEIATCECY